MNRWNFPFTIFLLVITVSTLYSQKYGNEKVQFEIGVSLRDSSESVFIEVVNLNNSQSDTVTVLGNWEPGNGFDWWIEKDPDQEDDCEKANHSIQPLRLPRVSHSTFQLGHVTPLCLPAVAFAKIGARPISPSCCRTPSPAW